MLSASLEVTPGSRTTVPALSPHRPLLNSPEEGGRKAAWRRGAGGRLGEGAAGGATGTQRGKHQTVSPVALHCFWEGHERGAQRFLIFRH